jgi:protein-disulfide isomerase
MTPVALPHHPPLAIAVVRNHQVQETWLSLLGILGALLLSTGSPEAAAPHPMVADAGTVLQVTKDDRILGDPDAPITIVEYASLSCHHCAHFANDVLPEIRKEWIDTGKAKLVLRDFPTDQAALPAAMVARCAPPERYYAFVDTFFEAQEKWAHTRDYREALARLAKFGGMGKSEFDVCLKNTELENKIVEQRLIATTELQVDATPTFFVNGNKFTGAPTVEGFKKILSSLAAKS